ncbi:hypothetical protein DPMN_160768 [Dreissena polymorpha]|uniref:Uncharacterized protein n=1 Tax=Dreissena polymorpha TaxID=45954 RepID=A0A9D4EP50_DREPO|nr:hypothetical protein DPMN_160768 [Dreissena polymorpha]
MTSWLEKNIERLMEYVTDQFLQEDQYHTLTPKKQRMESSSTKSDVTILPRKSPRKSTAPKPETPKKIEVFHGLGTSVSSQSLSPEEQYHAQFQKGAIHFGEKMGKSSKRSQKSIYGFLKRHFFDSPQLGIVRYLN